MKTVINITVNERVLEYVEKLNKINVIDDFLL